MSETRFELRFHLIADSCRDHSSLWVSELSECLVQRARVTEGESQAVTWPPRCRASWWHPDGALSPDTEQAAANEAIVSPPPQTLVQQLSRPWGVSGILCPITVLSLVWNLHSWQAIVAGMGLEAVLQWGLCTPPCSPTQHTQKSLLSSL